MKFRRWLRAVRTRLIMGYALLFLVFTAPLAHAIATGYITTDSGLQTGMAVALTSDDSDESTVERATQASYNNFVGIVTTVDASLIAVGSGNSTVFVENEGQVEAYVSDINGVVQKGDLLTVSSLKGVLMRLGDSSLAVIGVAASSSEETASYSFEQNGETKQTQISKIQVNLNYQGAQSGASTSNSALARLGQSLVGREVSETRVLIALVLFVIVLIAEGGIIYGAVSSAITALGRNPLAKAVIRGEFLRVSVVALLVLLVGLGAVYAVLWI